MTQLNADLDPVLFLPVGLLLIIIR